MRVRRHTTSHITLYPLRFEPIYQYRLWSGRRLAGLLTAPLPGDGPVGEAWVLSGRDDHESHVADGPLKGRTIGQLPEQSAEHLLGKMARRLRRFPLLLKLLDAREMLPVQVHPADSHRDLLPAGETGKTEAWVVMEASREGRIYASLKPSATADHLRRALTNRAVADHLVGFTPKPGDGAFLPSGTVHALGGEVVVFEVQQNSDVTFRLYDWGPMDDQTGQPRTLQVDQALACSGFGRVRPVWWCPWWRRPRRRGARDSFSVNISDCGACADNRRSPSVWRVCLSAVRCGERVRNCAAGIVSEVKG